MTLRFKFKLLPINSRVINEVAESKNDEGTERTSFLVIDFNLQFLCSVQVEIEPLIPAIVSDWTGFCLSDYFVVQANGGKDLIGVGETGLVAVGVNGKAVSANSFARG